MNGTILLALDVLEFQKLVENRKFGLSVLLLSRLHPHLQANPDNIPFR
jgi:hypothetical protein